MELLLGIKEYAPVILDDHVRLRVNDIIYDLNSIYINEQPKHVQARVTGLCIHTIIVHDILEATICIL